MKAYLASGWFTEEQEKNRRIVELCLINAEIPFYNPKEDGLYNSADATAL